MQHFDINGFDIFLHNNFNGEENMVIKMLIVASYL